MQESARDSLNFQKRLKSLLAISLELSRITSIDDLCQTAVILGHSQLGIDRLGLWFFDGEMMRGSFGIDEAGELRDERSFSFIIDENSTLKGLIASEDTSVLRTESPLFDAHSQVIGTGWSVVAIMREGKKFIGWLTADNFINRHPIESYEEELLGLYSTTIGHLVNHLRTENTLHKRKKEEDHFREKLRLLHEVSSELSHETSFDTLCYRAMELGQKRLGFDRIGLWFFDNDPTYLSGSYGIDEHGQIRDERNQRVSAILTERREVMNGRVLVSSAPATPLYDDQRRIVGYGWNAVAQVWDGDKSIGWLSTDNLFSHEPLSDYYLEILSLYATTIGHLTRTLKTREELAKERNLLRTIIDTVPDYIFVKDAEARFILINKSGIQAIPGATDEERIIGKSDHDFFTPEVAAVFYQDDRRVLDEGIAIVNHEEDGTYPENNRRRILLTTKAPLFDTSDNITGLVGVTRDITIYKELEHQALNLEVERARVKILQEFITSITHDLRTPLANINTSLYILGRSVTPEKQAFHLESIKRQAAHLDRIIQDILTIARLDNMPDLHLAPVNLNVLVDIIRESMEEAFQQKNIELRIVMADTIPETMGDVQELYPAMMHLVYNAFHYTPSGERVTLRTCMSHGRLLFEVEDGGIGISEVDLPHIFERFFRADKARSIEKGGSGLGLTIAKKIIEMHNGTIEVNSQTGQGSLFRIVLPVGNSA